MVKEAEKFAGEDKKRREAVDVKNQSESMIYQTEKQLKEFEGKVCDGCARFLLVMGLCCFCCAGCPMAPMACSTPQHATILSPLPSLTLPPPNTNTQVPADVKASIEGKVKELRDAITADDLEAMKKGMEALQQEVIKMGQVGGLRRQAGLDAWKGWLGGRVSWRWARRARWPVARTLEWKGQGGPRPMKYEVLEPQLPKHKHTRMAMSAHPCRSGFLTNAGHVQPGRRSRRRATGRGAPGRRGACGRREEGR